MRRLPPAAWAAIAALLTAGLGGLATELSPWYYALKQPPWKPPDWLFGPVWTLIYALSATAGVLAWKAAASAAARRGLLAAWALNAALNIGWSWLFFTMRRPDWALAEWALLAASVAGLVVQSARLRPLAGALLLPYLAWIGFAGALNLAVVRLNA